MIDFSKVITAEQRAENERIAKLIPLTPRQFRDALVDNGIMPDDIESAILNIPDDHSREKMLNAWNYAIIFDRNDPYIDIIAGMFDLSGDDIDSMWLNAIDGDK